MMSDKIYSIICSRSMGLGLGIMDSSAQGMAAKENLGKQTIFTATRFSSRVPFPSLSGNCQSAVLLGGSGRYEWKAGKRVFKPTADVCSHAKAQVARLEDLRVATGDRMNLLCLRELSVCRPSRVCGRIHRQSREMLRSAAQSYGVYQTPFQCL